ncbi:MAG TPA: CHC2 zinc finger domain-containing protein, partial [Acidobacteriota bacterium]
MKIDQSVIDEIKGSVDIVDYIGARIQLKKNGKDWWGLCPFHPDTKPSFVVSRTKQLFNCLGACAGNGEASGGDVITFVMKYESCTFPEAIAKLRPLPPVQVPQQSRIKTPALLSQALERYHRSFLESVSAQEYISSRGLDPALLKQYKTGYADGALLDAVSKESAEWKLLKEIGIITPLGAEHFAGCVVFPLTAFNQYAVGAYG